MNVINLQPLSVTVRQVQILNISKMFDFLIFLHRKRKKINSKNFWSKYLWTFSYGLLKISPRLNRNWKINLANSNAIICSLWNFEENSSCNRYSLSENTQNIIWFPRPIIVQNYKKSVFFDF